MSTINSVFSAPTIRPGESADLAALVRIYNHYITATHATFDTEPYAIGARAGRGLIRKIGGKKIHRLGKILAKQGLLTVAIVRNLPVAPFTIVNLLAGASRIRFRDYLIGTAVGMVPGVLAISIFADRLILAVKDPKWWNIAIAIGLAVVLGLGMWWGKKRISREQTE